MRVIQIMFDTLSREYLPNYGNQWVIAPNFKRLEKTCSRFDQFYGGSMPCMPARREMHTGQYNFLHRGWGPLEPFDFSVIEELKQHDIYTHLCSDHSHYWEDGGATYHNRYDTWDGFRGQEGDRWMPHDGSMNETIPKRSPLSKTGISVKQHYANMQKQQIEEDFSSVKTFQAGIEFIKRHKDRDNWLLQIETFDPHEPYEVPQCYRDQYGLTQEPYFNWGAYMEINSKEHQKDLALIRKEYAALITMCDHYLGKVLDIMDENDMWKDTILLIHTDHGFLLGEHEFLGKNIPPMYEELIHIPCFLHVPNKLPMVIDALCQTIDLPATLLDIFELEKPKHMMGKSLLPLLDGQQKQHEDILYGVFGSYVCYFDGVYTLMKAPQKNASTLYQYTLMPTKARGFFEKELLYDMELVKTEQYSHGMPVCKIPSERVMICGYERQKIQDVIFDLKNDPKQKHPIQNDSLYEALCRKLVDKLKQVQVPDEVYERLGLEK